jgi:histidinol-phosphatase
VATQADLDLALSCSDAAAELALTYFEVGVEASTKADGTPVTEADRAVEHLLRRMLDSEVPGDALLGEELGRLGDAERLWILDPVDGTVFFSRSDPNWRVHVALEVAGNTEVAVVTAPALGCQWWATCGGGAFESSWPRDGHATRLRVSRTASLAGAILDALDSESPGASSP